MIRIITSRIRNTVIKKKSKCELSFAHHTVDPLMTLQKRKKKLRSQKRKFYPTSLVKNRAPTHSLEIKILTNNFMGSTEAAKFSKTIFVNKKRFKMLHSTEKNKPNSRAETDFFPDDKALALFEERVAGLGQVQALACRARHALARLGGKRKINVVFEFQKFFVYFLRI
jgi:hypothetical protein